MRDRQTGNSGALHYQPQTAAKTLVFTALPVKTDTYGDVMKGKRTAVIGRGKFYLRIKTPVPSDMSKMSLHKLFTCERLTVK